MTKDGPDAELFELARVISLARVELCYGKNDRRIAKLENMQAENYHHNSDPDMDIGLASAKALLKRYQLTPISA